MTALTWHEIGVLVYPDDDAPDDVFEAHWSEQERRKAHVLVPGNAVRLVDGRELLVGNINPHAGSCGCCSFEVDEIVAWARVLPWGSE